MSMPLYPVTLDMPAPPKRRCSHPNCTAWLSRYNLGVECWHHGVVERAGWEQELRSLHSQPIGIRLA
jgi:hypothetical protein